MKLDALQLGLIAAIAAACPLSIFAAQVLLALAALAFLARLFLGRTQLRRTAVDGPILAFCVWSLLSASFAPDPVASHESAKKLVLFVIFYVALDSLARDADRERILDAMLLGGLVLGAGALLQRYFLGFDTLNNRPRSFLGHYMTASGLLMMVLVLAAARLVFRSGPLPTPSRSDLQRLGLLVALLGALTLAQRFNVMATEARHLLVAMVAGMGAVLAFPRRAWPGPATGTTLALLALPVCGWALLISRTRNAWIGAVAGLAVVAVLKAPRSLWLIPAGIAVILILRPASVVERLTIRDAASRDRYYMWQAGVDMIRDKPVFGQGPGMVLATYPSYRWPEAPNPQAPHLHNNPLQIAAERGLPCLAWWLWWMAASMGDAYRASRNERTRAAGASALAVLTAVVLAGLFEYNLGDSEVLMLFLMIAALPYAVQNAPAPAPEPSAVTAA